MCTSLLSGLICITNFLTAIIGTLLLVSGALLHWGRDMLLDKLLPSLVDPSHLKHPNEARKLLSDMLDNFDGFGLAIFIFGIVLFIVSVLAICGVCLKNSVILGSYAALVIIILLAMVICTIIFAVRRNWVLDVIGKIYLTRLQKAYEDQNQSTMELFQFVEEMGRCCGYNGPGDYGALPPSSCCIERPIPKACSDIYTDGCKDQILNSIEGVYLYILYTLISVCIFCFFFASMAIYLLCTYKRDDDMKMV